MHHALHPEVNVKIPEGWGMQAVPVYAIAGQTTADAFHF